MRQRVGVEDVASFIAYLKEYSRSTSKVFFAPAVETFEGIIDYHATSRDAEWCEHSLKFIPRRSLEFTTWMGMNRKQMTQVDFARFLEENLPDVAEPNSADLLEIALTFEAKKEVEYSSGVRLQNGQIQFTYNELVRGASKTGTIDVPEQIILGIPIHENGDRYRIPARFRWRLQEGKCVFWYEIVRPQRFIEDANHKNPKQTKEVKVLWATDRRYNLSDFEEFLDQEGIPDTEAQETAALDWAAQFDNKPLVIDLSRRIAQERIDGWLENDMRFRNTWNRLRHDLKDQSNSGYDLALACFGAETKLSEQDIVTLIVHNRTVHGHPVPSAPRLAIDDHGRLRPGDSRERARGGRGARQDAV